MSTIETAEKASNAEIIKVLQQLLEDFTLKSNPISTDKKEIPQLNLVEKLNIARVKSKLNTYYRVANKQIVNIPENITICGLFTGDTCVALIDSKYYLYRNFSGKLYKIDKIGLDYNKDDLYYLMPVTEEGDKFLYCLLDTAGKYHIGVITRNGHCMWQQPLPDMDKLVNGYNIHPVGDYVAVIQPGAHIQYLNIEDGKLLRTSKNKVTMERQLYMSYLTEEKLFYGILAKHTITIEYYNLDLELVGIDELKEDAPVIINEYLRSYNTK
jgi:hypothetical protein